MLPAIQVEQKVERLRQTEASLEKRIEREQAEVFLFTTSHFFTSFLEFQSFFETFSQVKAAWEELEARREEFLKEKKVLAHLGFY